MSWVLCDSYDCPIERHPSLKSALASIGLDVAKDLAEGVGARVVHDGGAAGAYAALGDEVFEASTDEGCFIIRPALPEDRVRRG